MNPTIKLILLGMLFTGCASYHGVGDFQTGERYMSARRQPAATAAVVQTPAAPVQRTPTYSLGKFQLYWPVAVIHVNRGFRPASDRNHQGVDLGGKRGTPIYAAHEGRVVYVGHEFNGYGNMVILEFNHEWATLYGHLDRFGVKQGQAVKPGTVIGYMGSTGHATGVHLHFEVMHQRLPTDPLTLLTKPAALASATHPKSIL